MRRTFSLARQFSQGISQSTPAASSAAGALQGLDNAADRSIHVKIHPRPRSLAESRQVLQELRRYGEIEVFRHLKHELEPAPNTAIIVYREASAAKEALTDYQINFRYKTSDETSTSKAHGRSASKNEATAVSEAQNTGISDLEPYPRPGHISMRRPSLLHIPWIQRQAYYGPVEVDYESGKPGLPMLAKVPDGLQGLRDFDLNKAEPSFRTRDSIIRARNMEFSERGWESLSQLWELGRRERAAKGQGNVE